MTTTLTTYLGYRDAPTALDWLHRALGFRTTMSFPDDTGGIAHAEARTGDAVVIVFSDVDGYERPPRRGETGGHGTYLAVDSEAEVDARFAAALEAGAEVVWKPEPTPWGNYRFRVLDPEGFEWTVGVHRPGDEVTWQE